MPPSYGLSCGPSILPSQSNKSLPFGFAVHPLGDPVAYRREKKEKEKEKKKTHGNKLHVRIIPRRVPRRHTHNATVRSETDSAEKEVHERVAEKVGGRRFFHHRGKRRMMRFIYSFPSPTCSRVMSFNSLLIRFNAAIVLYMP